MYVYFSWPKKHIEFYKRFMTITCCCPAIILDTDYWFGIQYFMMLIMRKCDDDEDNEDMSQVTDGQLSLS